MTSVSYSKLFAGKVRYPHYPPFLFVTVKKQIKKGTV